MPTPLRLRVLTPTGTKFDDHIKMVEVKTPEGYIGLMANHSPFVANIQANVMYVTHLDGTREAAITDQATIYMNRECARLFAFDFVFVSDIDFAKVAATKNALEQQLASLSSDPVAKKGMQQKLAYAQLQLSQQAKQN